jgi:hypothetical protein
MSLRVTADESPPKLLAYAAFNLSKDSRGGDGAPVASRPNRLASLRSGIGATGCLR